MVSEVVLFKNLHEHVLAAPTELCWLTTAATAGHGRPSPDTAPGVTDALPRNA